METVIKDVAGSKTANRDYDCEHTVRGCKYEKETK